MLKKNSSKTAKQALFQEINQGEIKGWEMSTNF